METIRVGVFETNSSSTHSLTMCTREEYDKWKKGELLYSRRKECLVTIEKACESCNIEFNGELYDNDDNYADKIDNALEYCYWTYEEFWDNEYLEGFEDSYTTKGGEEIVAFGLYGED